MIFKTSHLPYLYMSVVVVPIINYDHIMEKNLQRPINVQVNNFYCNGKLYTKICTCFPVDIL